MAVLDSDDACLGTSFLTSARPVGLLSSAEMKSRGLVRVNSSCVTPAV